MGSCFVDPLERSQWRKFKQMQPVWICIHSGRHFDNAYESTQRIRSNKCNQWNFDNGLIWKDAVKKRKTNATYTLLVLIQALRVNILKPTEEKNQTNVTNALLNFFRQAIWGRIWKHTMEINKTNATNINFCPFRFVIGHFWKSE